MNKASAEGWGAPQEHRQCGRHLTCCISFHQRFTTHAQQLLCIKICDCNISGRTLIFLFLVNPSPHLLRRSETPCLSLLESSFLILKMTPFLCILAPVGSPAPIHVDSAWWKAYAGCLLRWRVLGPKSWGLYRRILMRKTTCLLYVPHLGASQPNHAVTELNFGEEYPHWMHLANFFFCLFFIMVKCIGYCTVWPFSGVQFSGVKYTDNVGQISLPSVSRNSWFHAETLSPLNTNTLFPSLPAPANLYSAFYLHEFANFRYLT